MAAPNINITNYTRSRISAKAGVDVSSITFQANQPLVNWEARADGNGVGQGDLVGSPANTRETWDALDALGLSWDELDAENRTWDNIAVIAAAETDVVFDVENEELSWGDKDYRINVYGKNAAGEWTTYG